MTDKIDWPIGEPIETTDSSFTARVLHKDTLGDMTGYIQVFDDGSSHIYSWYSNGDPKKHGGIALIPPKRKPRTAEIWIKWDEDVIDDVTCSLYPVTSEWEHMEVVHPADRMPITREDVILAVLGRGHVVDNIMALLEERGD